MICKKCRAATIPACFCRRVRDLVYKHDAYVSSGGWIETVRRDGPDAVAKYLKEAKEVGFDVIGISAGFLTIRSAACSGWSSRRARRFQSQAATRHPVRLGRRFRGRGTCRGIEEGHRRPGASRQAAAGCGRGHHDRIGAMSPEPPASTLPGFMRLRGSRTRLTERIRASSTGSL